MKEFKNAVPTVENTKGGLDIPKVGKNHSQKNLFLSSLKRSKRFIQVTKDETK